MTLYIDETLPPTWIGDGSRERPFRSVRQAIYGTISLYETSEEVEIVRLPRGDE
jgi:hypothetical protein